MKGCLNGERNGESCCADESRGERWFCSEAEARAAGATGEAVMLWEWRKAN
jgi:hypothetical protein